MLNWKTADFYGYGRHVYTCDKVNFGRDVVKINEITRNVERNLLNAGVNLGQRGNKWSFHIGDEKDRTTVSIGER